LFKSDDLVGLEADGIKYISEYFETFESLKILKTMSREELKALLELIKDRSDRALQAINNTSIPTHVILVYFEQETNVKLNK
jgi:hypothetical protein